MANYHTPYNPQKRIYVASAGNNGAIVLSTGEQPLLTFGWPRRGKQVMPGPSPLPAGDHAVEVWHNVCPHGDGEEIILVTATLQVAECLAQAIWAARRMGGGSATIGQHYHAPDGRVVLGIKLHPDPQCSL